MDLELVRTFLGVVDTGSFIGASDRLHVTQAAVSRRIRALEERLGCALFTRSKHGAALTRSGRRFQRHAVNLLRTYEQARHELGSPGRFDASLVVGGRLGLWAELMLEWVGRLRERTPSVRVRAEIGFEEDLMHRLVEGSLDIGVMYTPQSRPGLEVEPLLDEELVLVSSAADRGGPNDAAGGYVYVDWGPEFRSRHTLAFPEFGGSGLVAGVGWIGLEHVLARGGSGYFPRRLVAEHLATGRLAEVRGAPGFTMPAYVVHPSAPESDAIAPALELLREVAAEIGRAARPARRRPRRGGSA